MGTLEKQWQSFREQVIPANANEVQLAAMRQAFYAGALVTFGEVKDLSTMCESHAVAKMVEMDEELQGFREEASAMAQAADE